MAGRGHLRTTAWGWMAGSCPAATGLNDSQMLVQIDAIAL